jgi:hypothetical protein
MPTPWGAPCGKAAFPSSYTPKKDRGRAVFGLLWSFQPAKDFLAFSDGFGNENDFATTAAPLPMRRSRRNGHQYP